MATLARLLLRCCLWIVLATGLLAQGATAPCSFCAGGTIACPTCTQGKVEVPCVFCDGAGKDVCATCNPERPGKIDCPNPYCRDGLTRWQGGDTDPCKLCTKKGHIACPDCRGQAAGRCAFCAGTGARPRTCWTCAGARRIECPLCSFDPTKPGCSVCKDVGELECRLCTPAPAAGPAGAAEAKPVPPPLVACNACRGRGDLTCRSCSGLDKVACTRCGATGKMRMTANKPGQPAIPGIPGEKAGVKECDLCSGKAVRNCPDCKKGRIDCATCERGRVAARCTTCLNAGRIGCDACQSGGHARFELLADLLVARGQPARAATLLEQAVRRARALEGPTGTQARQVKLLDLQQKLFETRSLLASVEALTGRSRTQALDRRLPYLLEGVWPRDLQERHWPDPPAKQRLMPWLDPVWLRSHRERLVARLQTALEKATAAAAPK